MGEFPEIIIDVSNLYRDTGNAKLDHLSNYEAAVLEEAASARIVKLTGAGPIWLYLRLAHVLHGRIARLIYDSPVTGEIVIFDHDPF